MPYDPHTWEFIPASNTSPSRGPIITRNTRLDRASTNRYPWDFLENPRPVNTRDWRSTPEDFRNHDYLDNIQRIRQTLQSLLPVCNNWDDICSHVIGYIDRDYQFRREDTYWIIRGQPQTIYYRGWFLILAPITPDTEEGED